MGELPVNEVSHSSGARFFPGVCRDVFVAGRGSPTGFRFLVGSLGKAPAGATVMVT